MHEQRLLLPARFLAPLTDHRPPPAARPFFHRRTPPLAGARPTLAPFASLCSTSSAALTTAAMRPCCVHPPLISSLLATQHMPMPASASRFTKYTPPFTHSTFAGRRLCGATLFLSQFAALSWLANKGPRSPPASAACRRASCRAARRSGWAGALDVCGHGRCRGRAVAAGGGDAGVGDAGVGGAAALCPHPQGHCDDRGAWAA